MPTKIRGTLSNCRPAFIHDYERSLAKPKKTQRQRLRDCNSAGVGAIARRMISYRRLAPVLRRDLHEEAVGIPEIDRRAACIGLIRISRFGVRQLAVDFVSEAFGSDPIHMVDCHCEMCDHAL